MTLTGLAASASLMVAISLASYAWIDGAKQEVDDVRSRQNATLIALAHLQQYGRCAVPATEVTLSAARASLAPRIYPEVEDEANWRIQFVGDVNRRRSATVYRLDGNGQIIDKRDHVLPLPGRERTQSFLDAAFEDRVCP